MAGKNAKYNSSGYLDMTAYLALRNIQRRETGKRKAKRRTKEPKK